MSISNNNSNNNNNNNNNNNDNNNNTYIAPISILVFSTALKNKNIKKKKILRLHKVYMQKVHGPTKKSKAIMSTLKLYKLPRLLKS